MRTLIRYATRHAGPMLRTYSRSTTTTTVVQNATPGFFCRSPIPGIVSGGRRGREWQSGRLPWQSVQETTHRSAVTTPHCSVPAPARPAGRTEALACVLRNLGASLVEKRLPKQHRDSVQGFPNSGFFFQIVNSEALGLVKVETKHAVVRRIPGKRVL